MTYEDWTIILAIASFLLAIISIVFLWLAFNQNKKTLQHAKDSIFIEKEIMCTSEINSIYFHFLDSIKEDLKIFQEYKNRVYSDSNINENANEYLTLTNSNNDEKIKFMSRLRDILVEYRPFLSVEAIDAYFKLDCTFSVVVDKHTEFLKKTIVEIKVLQINNNLNKKTFINCFDFDSCDLEATINELSNELDTCIWKISEYIQTKRNE